MKEVAAAHPEVEVHIYSADHGFNCDQRESYDAPSAALAWKRTLAFLPKHLRGASSCGARSRARGGWRPRAALIYDRLAARHSASRTDCGRSAMASPMFVRSIPARPVPAALS
jgi:hypothetical protein